MLAAVAAALFSCNKVEEMIQEEPKQEEPQNEAKGIPVTLKGTLDQTKTEIDGETLYWGKGDEIQVLEVNEAVADILESNDLVSERKATASFQGTVTNPGDHFAVYYSGDEFSWDGTDMLMAIPAQQTIPAAGGTFDPKADILISNVFNVSEANQVLNPSFSRLTSYIKVIPKGTLGYTIDKVTISSSQTIAGKLSLVHEDNVLNFTEESNTIEVTDGTYTLTSDGSKFTYIGIAPVTLAAGATLTVEIEAEGHHWVATKTLDADLVFKSGHVRPINLNLTEANEAHLVLEKVWGHYGVAGVAGWPAYVTGVEDLDGPSFLRNACFDDDYVYIPKTSSESTDGNNFNEASIFKFSVADGSYAGKVQRTTDPDYMAGTWASTFPVSCARVMKNTDPTVNNGKDVLVCANLSDGAQRIRLYAWENGTNAQPKLLTNITGMSERRWGDRISVTGTYQSGRVWYRNFYSVGTTAWFDITNGAISTDYIVGLGAIATDSDNCASEYKSFGSYGLISTNIGAGTHLIKGTTKMESYVGYKRCFGWDAFEYKGKKYLAYLDMSGGTNLPIVTVLEGATDTYENLKATLDAKNVVVRASIAQSDPDDFSTTGVYAANNQGDCQVRFINGEPYILGVTRGGIALFKLVLK